ncbi:uncharacterized protein LOC101839355 isoform X3 [Mesocricetus auratus]|uniref:Uncharacterized protein LOC101839355 isoform X3 n=1 Tax=Mesocricetus auratus TaxID=10036 RepID=A0ABM2XAP8_MESAU|nr:uncharacterized protein LOC101839355 isoform X3 [Mesocricetus auratus]
MGSIMDVSEETVETNKDLEASTSQEQQRNTVISSQNSPCAPGTAAGQPISARRGNVQRFYKRQRRHRQHRMPKKRLIEKYLIKVVRGGGMPSDQNHQHNVELGKNDPQQEGSSPSTRESTGDMTSPETQRDQDPSPPQRS